uniref:Hyaluronan/mRNA-binding protein domain-containing protein n=1 Tax=Davidia involucrata TaxID=16924 RepID=A0A5B7CE38_DAVIN
MNNSEKREAHGRNGRHATNGEDNTGRAEKNVLATIVVSKDAEPEKGRLDQLASQDDLKKKAREEEEERKAREEEEEKNKMTLEEYEKLLLEKRKALEALKTEERKVALDKDFELMQLVEKKKEDSLFIKLNSEKDKLKRKESLDKDEKVRKVKSQQLFIGEIHIRGSGRSRGRGDRGGYRGGYLRPGAAVPAIGDSCQFPILGKPGRA